MNVLVISGSRNPEGQTASAGDALLQGVMQAGGQGEQIFLPALNIERCRQCDSNGWGTCRSEAKCCIQDDFDYVLAKIKEADAVVFATPVYYSDLSESLRAFLDRLRRQEAGRENNGIQGKRAIGVCVAGGGGGGAPKCTVSLEWTLTTCGFDVVDMVPARRQNLEMKREVLKTLGEWLIK